MQELSIYGILIMMKLSEQNHKCQNMKFNFTKQLSRSSFYCCFLCQIIPLISDLIPLISPFNVFLDWNSGCWAPTTLNYCLWCFLPQFPCYWRVSLVTMRTSVLQTPQQMRYIFHIFNLAFNSFIYFLLGKILLGVGCSKLVGLICF